MLIMQRKYNTQQAGILEYTDIQCLQCSEYKVWRIECGVHICTNCSHVWHSEREPTKDEINTIVFLIKHLPDIDKEARMLESQIERHNFLHKKVKLMGRPKDYL